jgi:RNA polymerase sigma factor (TIGR02999 family)
MKEPDITVLLRRVAAGEEGAEKELYPLVYEELHRLATQMMRSERPGHTLQATALVNEAYLRLTRSESLQWQDRTHFFAVCSKIMRRILVDYARQHRASKRGGGLAPVELDKIAVCSDEQCPMFEALDDALNKLQTFDERQVRIVEWRFFGGLTEEEIARMLNLSVRTVKRDWNMARAWLYGELSAKNQA